jgi:integral membrane protein
MESRINFLRFVGLAEGISFIVLLFIAMPIKYMLGIPEVVKYVGWAHGVLFILYIVAVFAAIRPMAWNWFWTLVALGASLIPFGTFLMDRQLKRRLVEISSTASSQV